MLFRMPCRTSRTKLTDDEVIILDALFDRLLLPPPFDWSLSINSLRREHFSDVVNLSYSHELSREELEETLRRLEREGILQTRPGRRGGTYWGLTELGGQMWEEERAPDWDHFVFIKVEVDADGKRKVIIARSPLLEVARAYLEAERACGRIRVRPEGWTSAVVRDARLLPWKTFALIHEVRAPLDPAGEVDGAVEWEQFVAGRTWWSRVSELHDFPPSIPICLSPGDGDAELAARVRDLEGKLDRVVAVNLLGTVHVDLRSTAAEGAPPIEGTRVTDDGIRCLERLPRLANLLIESASITDRALETIGRLANLEDLMLEAGQFTDEGVARLSGLLKLRALDLPRAQITDRALPHIARLSELRRLNLYGTRIEGSGLEALKFLTHLEELFIGWTGISDASLVPLSGCTQLTHLELGGTGVGDAGLRHISGLTFLHWLLLSGTKVSDEGLRSLAGMHSLQDLWLDHTAISDAGLAAFAGLENLRQFLLGNTGVTDAGLRHLSGLRNLRSLALNGTTVTDEGLRHLSGLHSLCSLSLSGTAITDAGLEHLLGLNLRWIGLSQTNVTPEGMERLQRAMPGVEIL